MKRNQLIAMAVGTVLSAALSAAYADQPAPASGDQQTNQGPANASGNTGESVNRCRSRRAATRVAGRIRHVTGAISAAIGRTSAPTAGISTLTGPTCGRMSAICIMTTLNSVRA